MGHRAALRIATGKRRAVAGRLAGAAGCLVLLSLLAGCSWFRGSEDSRPPCPSVTILSDVAKVTLYREGGGRDVTDVVAHAEFANFSGECTYDAAKKKMTMTLQVAFDVTLGPAAGGRQVDLAYFAAIPNFYPSDKAKSILPIHVTFPGKENQTRFIDQPINFVIPVEVKGPSDLGDLNKDGIILGFQLTPEQLDYNRQHRPAY